MGFREPLVLIGLGLLPLAVAAYVAAQRRRRRFAVRYTNVDILASVAKASPLRHLPALLALLRSAACSPRSPARSGRSRPSARRRR
jgi:Ca-activated chloride channel family protein